MIYTTYSTKRTPGTQKTTTIISNMVYTTKSASGLRGSGSVPQKEINGNDIYYAMPI